MGMYVYKMFNPGLTCRGYQFNVGVNECAHATCVREGFHAAENPLDCLSYYPDFDKSECWLCYAGGDVHEDGSDSKISCTRLEILRRLSKEDFIVCSLQFMAEHPKRKWSTHVYKDTGEVCCNGFVVVRGTHPKARGKKIGDYLAFAKEASNGEIVQMGLYRIDGVKILPGIWYDHRGSEKGNVVCE